MLDLGCKNGIIFRRVRSRDAQECEFLSQLINKRDAKRQVDPTISPFTWVEMFVWRRNLLQNIFPDFAARSFFTYDLENLPGVEGYSDDGVDHNDFHPVFETGEVNIFLLDSIISSKKLKISPEWTFRQSTERESTSPIWNQQLFSCSRTSFVQWKKSTAQD